MSPERLAEQEADPWHAVADKLPPPGEWVIVRDDAHAGTPPGWPAVAYHEFGDVWQSSELGHLRPHPPTHWRRLGYLGVPEWQHVAALQRRVAELEEAARWRPASEAIPGPETVQITLYAMGEPCRSEGRKTSLNNWETPHGSRSDAGILGWRPLGPGPAPR